MLPASAHQSPFHGPPPADPVLAQLEAARATAHHGPSARRPRRGSALCLSGGGFRAALFHLGAVRRLDELGVLGSLRSLSAVSGGAVLATLLLHPDLEWPDADGGTGPGGGRVGGLEELVAAPLLALTRRNLRTPALLSRVSPRGWGRPDPSVQVLADELERAVPWWGTDLREHRRRGGPVVLTGVTEIGYGVSWLFADPRSAGPRGRIGDHRLGHAAPPPGLRLVDSVAASCAYPPFFGPLELDGADLGLTGGAADPDEPEAVREAIRRRIQLVDGGVYDNLALEPVWSDHATVLVSDGGAVFGGRPAGSVLSRLGRLLSIASSGGQTARLRWLRAGFAAGTLAGATWSLDSPADLRRGSGPGSPGPLLDGYDPEVVGAIHRVRTDLDAFSPEEQMVLCRYGYLVADASIRRHSPQVVRRDAALLPPHPQVAAGADALSALRDSGRITALGRR
ncbi:patatin-like phospholipase family protein [Serinicoccus marinus]|uniref:patatin-like phospholipase family protein n=1 Tax=Serinicoccus marinus TaxID=247333 RepID=UPI0003B465CC|nr:patatin-like phospholipase family protein [Serinicoccus marinus]